MNHRARRNKSDQVVCRLSGHVVGTAVFAILGKVVGDVSKGLQRVRTRLDFENHIAAFAAIAAIRAATRERTSRDGNEPFRRRLYRT